MVSFLIGKIKNSKLRFICELAISLLALIGLVFTLVFVGMKLNLFSVKGTIDDRNSGYFGTKDIITIISCPHDASSCVWNETSEWNTIKSALLKEALIINRVSRETGIPSRVLVAVVIPEQMRFFTSDRETVKKYLEPLKILGTLSQFSYGVSGIKPDTARSIETFAASSSSPFFAGQNIASLLALQPGENIDADARRFARLTNTRYHYYSFLYTAIFLREIASQWTAFGHPLSYSSDTAIYATIFNLGFAKSIPKENPSSGGAVIYVGGKKYSYGELARLFYESDELGDVFGK